MTPDHLQRELAATKDFFEARLDGADDARQAISDQFKRDAEALRELLEARMMGWEGASSSRHAAIQKTLDEIRQDIQGIPRLIDDQIAHLRALHDTKFLSIQRQLEDRDACFTTLQEANRVKVADALQAQKELARARDESSAAAIGKSEASVVKQIDGIYTLMTSNAKSIDDKLAVINGRLDRNEGGQGSAAALEALGLARSNTHSSNMATIIGFASLAVSVIVAGVALFHGGPQPQPPSTYATSAPSPSLVYAAPAPPAPLVYAAPAPQVSGPPSPR